VFNQEALPGVNLHTLPFSSRLNFNVVVMLEQMVITKQQAIVKETKTVITVFRVFELKIKYINCSTKTSYFTPGANPIKLTMPTPKL
jgi:hypothetical protein